MRSITRVLAVLSLVGAASVVQADLFDKDRQNGLADVLDRLAARAEKRGGLSAQSLAPAQAVPVVLELARGASARDVARSVEAAGGRLEGAAGNLVKARVPVRGLRAVAADRHVLRVRPPFRPNPKEVVSQGVAVMKADSYVTRTGANGAGVRVAVLDAGFQGVRELIGNELPADTVLASKLSGQYDLFADSPHGAACAEVVHDVAPGASLTLAGFEDEVDWATTIDELIAGGANVITHSIGWDNVFPPDGNNYFSQKIDAVAGAGVMFVTAAGNEARNYVHTTWRDDDGDTLLEFAPGMEMLPIWVDDDGSQVVLRWDDPFGASGHDYDLLIVTEEFRANPTIDSANTAIVAASGDTQAGGGDPREVAWVEGTGERRGLFVVVRHDPDTPLQERQAFHIHASGGVDPLLANETSSLCLPADARSAVSVGATAYSANGAVEGFSSRGPTEDGRVKPDLLGPDRVLTASYGSSFPGTSAATPHVAGAAALLLSRTPGLGLDAWRLQLEQATATGGLSKNNDSGYGLVDLSKAP